MSAAVFGQTRSEAQSNPAEKSPSAAAAAYFPNVLLQTQDDNEVRFYSDMLKGKIVMINFMFSTCQGICPPMTANLAKVQKLLRDNETRITMISITVDPLTDTAQRLKEYAAKFNAQPGWYFLTGKKENVDAVLKKLGSSVDDKNQHTSILFAGNESTGHWIKIFAMSKPEEIVQAVSKLFETK
jgi:cytochrome oxidase Cu insertion factor (SCO1/SenC/PrrC family)